MCRSDLTKGCHLSESGKRTRIVSWRHTFFFGLILLLPFAGDSQNIETFEGVGYPPSTDVIAGVPFTYRFRSTRTSNCRAVLPPISAIFVRPVTYISPPTSFARAGIVAESEVVSCNAGIYEAEVTVTVAAQYRQEVYFYVNLPSSESDDPIAVLGSPFDLDVLPAELYWPASSLICGRVSSWPWPDVCADGLGFEYGMAGLQLELMLQQADRFYNPVFECNEASPPTDLIQLFAVGNASRTRIRYGECDAACPQYSSWEPPQTAAELEAGYRCQSCPNLEPELWPVALTFSVGPCNPQTGAFHVRFDPTVSARYHLTVHVNGSQVDQAVAHRPGLQSAKLWVLPGEVVASASVAGGQEVVAGFSNWTNNVVVQLKDQFNNDRLHGVLYALQFDPRIAFFPQDPSYIALDEALPAVALCRLISPEGCGIRTVRQRMQRRYLGEGATVGIAAGLTTQNGVQELQALVLATPEAGSWVAPARVGQIRVVDMTDGTFQVQFFIRQPGRYTLAMWALGDAELGTHFVNLEQPLPMSPWTVFVENEWWLVQGHINEMHRPLLNLARFCPDASDAANAAACPTNQSSTVYMGVAARAVDADRRQQYSAQSCTHTEGAGSRDPWWRVELGITREVRRVRVYNRMDDREDLTLNLDGFFVALVSAQDVARAAGLDAASGGDQEAPWRDWQVPCATKVPAPGASEEGIVDVECEGAAGRVVIGLEGDRRVLTMCEVEVWGHAGRSSSPTPSEPGAVLAAGRRRWVSLRAKWRTGNSISERCPDRAPTMTMVSWAEGGADDGESGDGLQEHPDCRSATACPEGAPLVEVPVAASSCQRGQFLVSSQATVAGRYAFEVDVGGNIGKAGGVVPGRAVVAASTVSVGDVEHAFALVESTLGVQSRDEFGNANRAECLSGLQGGMLLLVEETMQKLIHGGESVGNLIDASPNNWPYAPEVVREQQVAVNMTVGECRRGRTTMRFLVSVSGFFRISVQVAAQHLMGSPSTLEVSPSFLPLPFNSEVSGFSPHSRWSHYTIQVPDDAPGFQLRATQIDGGQPWVFVQLGEPPTMPRGPYPGVPDFMFSSQECFTCRVHVMVTPKMTRLQQQGETWYVGVLGAYKGVSFKLHASVYGEEPLSPGQPLLAAIPASAVWKFFRLDLSDTAPPKVQEVRSKRSKSARLRALAYQGAVGEAFLSGFSIVVQKTGGDGFMSVDVRDSAVEAPRLRGLKCETGREQLCADECDKCVVSTIGSEDEVGRVWVVGVLAIQGSVEFTVAASTHTTRETRWGRQGTVVAEVGAYGWQHVTSFVDLDQRFYSGFRVEMVPERLESDIVPVVMKGRMPTTSTDEFFQGTACAHCRVTVLTQANLTGAWTVGVYGGSSGGKFAVRMLLLESCPNQCSGNGECQRRNNYNCKCNPGYQGLDCAEAVPSKVAAWFPLAENLLDRSNNSVRLVRRWQPDTVEDETSAVAVEFDAAEEQGAARLLGGFLQSRLRPLSAVHCTYGDRKVKLQFEAEDPAPRGPLTKAHLCHSYDFGRAFAVMGWFFASDAAPGNNSGITLGAPLWRANISPESDGFHWSFMLSLRPHPALDEDGMLCNFAVNQGDSRTDLDIASARDIDAFPARGVQVPEWDPILPMGQWHHIAGVFAHDRIQLFVGGELVAEKRRPMSSMRAVPNAVLHIGHDSRYPPNSRLFFGRIRDVRLLRYAPQPEELQLVASDTFKSVLAPTPLVTQEAASTGQHVDNEGSQFAPLRASQLDDGTLPTSTFSHGDFCKRMARVPNEEWDEVHSTDASGRFFHTCKFQGQTSWVQKRGKADPYTFSNAAISRYGVGSVVTVFADDPDSLKERQAAAAAI